MRQRHPASCPRTSGGPTESSDADRGAERPERDKPKPGESGKPPDDETWVLPRGDSTAPSEDETRVLPRPESSGPPDAATRAVVRSEATEPRDEGTPDLMETDSTEEETRVVGGEARPTEENHASDGVEASSPPGTIDRPLAELQLGTEFAGYLIEAAVARGQMGVIYRARNLRLERTEALKVIAARYAADADFRARFRREAMNAVIADHPHVVRVYDANECDGRLYIAMQFIDGVDLRYRLARDGPLPPIGAVDITRQVASALDAAHANGLIHRDVKPGNILLGGAPDAPEAYLSDFGVSRRMALASDLTQPGWIVGTPSYTAPEQHLGEAVDHRSDVYSLGCVLFEMLTGRKPFRGDTIAAVAMAHVQQPIPSARAVDHRLPRGLDRVLAKAMAKDPEERYQSAGQLAADAQAALSGEDEATLIMPATAETVATATGSEPDAGAATPPMLQPGSRGRTMILQIVALVSCLGLAAVLRWGHSYIGYGTGLKSLWDATRTGGDPSSPLRAVDFRNLILLVALAFLLLALSLAVLRRALTTAAAVVAVLIIAQVVRFWLGLGPHWDASHKVGTSLWVSLGLAVLIAVCSALAAAARFPRDGGRT